MKPLFIPASKEVTVSWDRQERVASIITSSFALHFCANGRLANILSDSPAISFDLEGNVLCIFTEAGPGTDIFWGVEGSLYRIIPRRLTGTHGIKVDFAYYGG
jgi:hypothetical protein